MNKEFECETPRHKKKKQSHKSASSKRSDHKHDYKKVLIGRWDDEYMWVDRCKTCGRLRSRSYSTVHDGLRVELNDSNSKYIKHRGLNSEELHKKFPDVEIYNRKKDDRGFTLWGDNDIERIY